MTHRRLLAVLAVAVVARVIVIVATPGFIPRNDAWDFDREAIALVHTGSFPASILTPGSSPTAFRPPLFPLALAGTYELTGARALQTRWATGRVLEVVLGTLTVALVYLLAVRLWGEDVALIAAAIAAVYPPLLLIGSSLLSESLFTPLVLLAVLAALRARDAERPLRWAMLAGVIVGLAALTRGNGIALVLPIGFLVWTERPRLRALSLRAPLAMVAATVLVLIPWTVRNQSVFHRFVPLTTETGYTLAGAYGPEAAGRHDFPYLWTPPVQQMKHAFAADPGGNEAAISDRLQSRAFSYMGEHPGIVAKTLGWNALRMLNLPGPGLERWGAPFQSYPRGLAVVSVYAFWLLGVLAVLGATTAAARRVPLALWGVPAAIMLSALPFITTTRLRAPADPFLILLAALAIRRGLDLLHPERRAAPTEAVLDHRPEPVETS
jgi:4-amino-4-deoxy-L-arabinose transferase-like glycosyltransferase